MEPTIPEKTHHGSHPSPAALAALDRIDRRLAQIEKLLEEFAGALLSAAYPHGDHRTNDRWSRGRR